MESCYLCKKTINVVTYFPKNITTLKKWKEILNINVDDKVLINKKLCIDHFDAKYHKILLDSTSVRGRYIFPINNAPNSEPNINIQSEGSSRDSDNKNKQVNYKLLCEIKNDKIIELEKKIKDLEKENINLKKKVKKASDVSECIKIVTEHAHNLTPSGKILAKLLLLNKKHVYSDDEVMFCKTFYYKYPSAFKYLRSLLGAALPATRTLIRWDSGKIFDVGIINEVMIHLKEKRKNLSDDDAEVSLVFDEMDGRKGLRYCDSRDTVIGFEDLITKTNKVAKKFLVFMIRGMNGKLGNVVVASFATETGVNGTVT